MELQLQHVFITCNPVVLFYTRDVNIVTESVKRCHLAGSCSSCSSQKCAHISSRSELHDTYEFPGIARCTTSCGGIGCGCLLPTLGCLFSRSYAKPKNDKIYQVFHCPTWQESALITFTYTGIEGGKRSEMITVDPPTTHVMKDANTTLEFITMPVIPLLGTVFLGSVDSNHSEVAIIEEEDFFALRCSNLKSASNTSECYVEDRCSCSPSETEAKCDCKNLDVNAKMTSTESRIPISSSVLHPQDDHGRVLGAVHSAVVDLTSSTSAMYHAEPLIDDENFDITSTSLQGCYNCLRGAEVTFSCYSNRPIMIEIECQKRVFSATCNSSTAKTTADIHSTVSRYKDSCQVKCGQKTHNLIISGVLAFHTHWRTPAGKRLTEHANCVNIFN
uniref:Phlebovirus_G2 domain-containing protein n=1 Tax=Haemonchus contortus TaxID=6289 RepID=A0A7I4XV80_HAECO